MLQEVINIALDDAFIRLRNIANGSSSEFIRIPQIDGSLRLSEQEFKWLFIQRLIGDENNNTLSFSLEDPTINGYVFSTKDKDKKAFTFCKHSMKKYKQYRSANIDLSIYERGRRVAIMEFKAGNPGPFYHAKDFFKLANEPDNVLRYFVEIYERTDSNTLENIKAKLFDNQYFNLSSNTLYIGYSLCHNENPSGTRFNCDLNNRNIITHSI